LLKTRKRGGNQSFPGTHFQLPGRGRNENKCKLFIQDNNNISCHFYTPVFKTGRIMAYQYPTVRPFHRVMELMVLRSVYFMVKFRFFIPELWDLNYYSVLFQHKYCINVPIHVYGAAVSEI
jgi:hypothetical protein